MSTQTFVFKEDKHDKECFGWNRSAGLLLFPQHKPANFAGFELWYLICAWLCLIQSETGPNSVFRSCWDGDSLEPYWLSTYQQLFWFLIVFWKIIDQSVFCICIFNFRLSYLTWPTISSLSFLRLLSPSTWQLCWCGSFWDIVACVWQSCRYS